MTDEWAEIALPRGKTTLVDRADLPLLGDLSRWSAQVFGNQWYVTRKVSSRRVLMHRLLLGIDGGPTEVLADHINGNGLDNRRSNLRIAIRSGNAANMKARGGASPYKGVSRHRKRWRATIRYAYRQHYLGTFDTEEEAARAYDATAREAFGAFARTNFEGQGDG